MGDIFVFDENNPDNLYIPISSNVISASNTSSNDYYQKRCKEEGVKRHPARFPQALPEFFINFCTEVGDIVLDPFAGSNMTGRVAETLDRKWIAIEIEEEYIKGSKFRFESESTAVMATESANIAKVTEKEKTEISDLPLFKK
ncbi:DNA methyltransferase [Crocosphaera sp. XPORK-15E]|uniref:DNA methyltransferase n=1 Tax=Crocosphaera sp. XPORK-15E TaxID=3110247 RepID=UPI002B1F6A20|nr:DNA methyltransferase [Crocosphaera sp. XPORK-15E]MEA5532898.1 DNA methyltransferase [Crocosphaera sp. XPORK-15E]